MKMTVASPESVATDIKTKGKGNFDLKFCL